MYKLTVIVFLFYSCSNNKSSLSMQRKKFIDEVVNRGSDTHSKDGKNIYVFDCLPWKSKGSGDIIYYYDSLNKLIKVEEGRTYDSLNETCSIYFLDGKVALLKMEGDIGALKEAYELKYYFDDSVIVFQEELGNKIKNVNSCLSQINQDYLNNK